MKILKLEFENINSLEGRWTIDFTVPAFVGNHNFFAITGPTGAGKSSILDAICLALYGETPRQGEITTDNQVMTKGTRFCSATVTYECRKGKYRSHWEQSLKIPTRGKNKGLEVLENYSDHIEREENGSWVSEPDLKGRSALALATTEILGLDYAQFTKSILLAQGAFSEFIRSSADVRSEILEKLTGSEKYRLIAQKVWERADGEKKKFAAKQADIGECAKLMDKAQYDANKSDIETLSEKQASLKVELEKLERELNWLAFLDSAKKNLEDARAAQRDACAAKTAFAPQAASLDAADRAANVESAYKVFCAAKENLVANERTLAGTGKSLEEKRLALSGAGQTLRNAEVLCETEKKRRAEEEPLWVAVSILDQQIADADRNVQEKRRAVTAAESALENHRKLQKENDGKIADAETELSRATEYQKANAQDALIIEIFSRLQEEVRQLKKVQASLASFKEKERSAEGRFNDAKADLDAENQKIDGYGAYLKTHAGDERLVREVSNFATLKDALLAARAELPALGEGKTILAGKVADAENAFVAARISLEKAAAEKNALEADGVPKIAAALRSRLQAGEPCPVCGSREHPSDASDGTVDLGTAGALASALDSLVKEERLANQAVLAAQTKLEIARSDSSDADTDFKRKQDEIRRKEDALAALWTPWNLSAGETEIERSFIALKARGDAYDKAREDWNDGQSSLSCKKDSFNAAKADLEACRKDIAASENEISELGKNLETEFSPWFSAFRVEDAEISLDVLAGRKEKWGKSVETMNSAANALSAFRAAAATLAANVSDAATALAKAKRECDDAKCVLEKIRDARREKFGDRDVAAEKRALTEKIEGLEKEVKNCTTAYDALKSSCDGLQGKLKTVKESVEAGTADCEQKKNTFTVIRVRNGFASDEAFFAARMAGDDRAALAKIRDDLQKRADTADGAVAQAKVALGKCRAEKLCAEDAAPELMARRGALTEEQKTTGDRLNAARFFCLGYEANAEKAQKLQQELLTLRISFEKWDRMRAWFGKQNGGDFVMFVQGITFGTLLREANRQLLQMAPRYEFFQKQESPLDLWIIDHDNGDEERPVSNLSGGETFLASLALALGIASLASENVSVDTLFLDEGFGTLDDKTLHNVINVLKDLQQREGKMLGIITHVESLKSEIPLRIEVSRVAGSGRSVLHCDGVVTAG